MRSNRFLLLSLFFLFLSQVYSETEDILIVGRSNAPLVSQEQLPSWKVHLESLGDVSVTIATTTPNDLSPYDEVWYADYQNWGGGGSPSGGTFQEPSNDAINNILPDYLASGGNIAFLTDHSQDGTNAAAFQTHNQMESFINNVTVIESFDIKDGPVGTSIWTGGQITLILDDPALNLDPSLVSTLESKTYTSAWTGAVIPSNVGSGIGVLQIAGPPSQAYIGIAFVGDSFKPQYQKGGRIFVFTDIFNSLDVVSTGEANYNLLELIAGFTTGKDLTRPKLDVDTSGIVVPTGDVYYSYDKGIDFIATISTDDSGYIEYSINGTKIGSNINKSVQVNFKDLPDSVVLDVTVTGTDIIETTKSWTFKRMKPADIILDTLSSGTGLPESPDTNIYTIPEPDIFITSENGDSVVYTINGGVETIYDGSFNLSTITDDTIIIEVTVSGKNVIKNTKSWIFVINKANAKLIAEPSNDSIYVYTTQFLDVILETNTGNKIVYQLISGTDTTAWDTTDDFSDTIQISGDVTINAFTIGTDYNSVSGSWVYDCELPELIVVADPSDTSFEMYLNIVLSAINSDTLVDALIKYIIDSTGVGFQASEVKANGVIYDPADSVKITNSVTIYVSAVDINGNYSDGFGSFTYTLDLLSLNITATPSKEPHYFFGTELDSIVIGIDNVPIVEGITLSWIMDSVSVSDSVTFVSSGVTWNGSNYPSIDSIDNDTMYLSVMAIGHGYETTFKTFKYVRQYLPVVKADPSDPNGHKFSGSVDVGLYIDTLLGDFENIKIYYIIDSISSGKFADENDTEIENYGSLTLTKTVFIKVIATADNAVKSEHAIYYYILSAGATAAWYKDVTAGGLADTVDGQIDAVTIDISKSVEMLPDSALFVSPFDTSEKVIAYKGDMAFADSDNNRILVTLPKPFNYSGSTKIDPSVSPNLGSFYGRYYVETKFNIADSVSPLINYAIYYPGDYELIKDSVSVHPDSILISFSEEVTIPGVPGSIVSPASFLSMPGMTPYDMDLIYDSIVNSNEILFVVDRVSNSILPSQGDSLRIDFADGVSDSYGNVQNVEENRFGYIRDVGEREYPYTLKALSPVVPSKMPVPAEIMENSNNFKGVDKGVLIVADYYTVLNTSKMKDAEAVVLDQVGNKLASIDGYGSSKNIAIEIVTIDVPRSKTMVVLVWDGTNSKGRAVASGMYKVLFNFTDPGGNKISESIPVGIMQEE